MQSLLLYTIYIILIKYLIKLWLGASIGRSLGLSVEKKSEANISAYKGYIFTKLYTLGHWSSLTSLAEKYVWN